MNDISVPIPLPLDEDGFLRRECPTCEREFKWFVHNPDDPTLERVAQYFCPLCGEPSAVDNWWTPEQISYATAVASPKLDNAVRDSLESAFKGVKGLRFEPRANFSLDLPAPQTLHEPNDMVILEPPCHGQEPIKIPPGDVARVHCLICGSLFSS